MYSQVRDSGESGGHKGVEHIKFTCDDEPTPDFDEALQALRPLIGDITELDPDYLSHAVVKSITFSEKSDKKGVVITATRPVEDSNAPFNIATPFRLIESLDEAQQRLVYAMEDQGIAYLNGDRTQASLPLDDEEEDDS